MSRILIGLSAAFAAMVPVSLWAEARPDDYHGPHMWADGWHMVFGPLVMILFIALIVVVVVLAVRWAGAGGSGRASPPSRTPMDILKERFALGEIDTEEFAERKRHLEE